MSARLEIYDVLDRAAGEPPRVLVPGVTVRAVLANEAVIEFAILDDHTVEVRAVGMPHRLAIVPQASNVVHMGCVR